MSEALISEPGLSLWERTRLFPRHVNRAASATAPKTLPEVRPGQLWYVERCLSFARDGWSVARLVDPGGERAGIIRQLSEHMLKFEASAAFAVSVFANTDGSYEKIAAELDELGEVIEARSFGQRVTLTIIFTGIDAGTAPRFVVASANGLAG